MSSLDEFHADFFQRVLLEADATGSFLDDAFFDLVSREVVEVGDLETADRAHHADDGNRPIRVDGYGGDPGNEDGTLTLIVMDFNQAAEIEPLDQRRLISSFNRLQRFLERARTREFRDGLEESTPAFGLCELISE